MFIMVANWINIHESDWPHFFATFPLLYAATHEEEVQLVEVWYVLNSVTVSSSREHTYWWSWYRRNTQKLIPIVESSSFVLYLNAWKISSYFSTVAGMAEANAVLGPRPTNNGTSNFIYVSIRRLRNFTPILRLFFTPERNYNCVNAWYFFKVPY